jgi:hypothetical protein
MSFMQHYPCEAMRSPRNAQLLRGKILTTAIRSNHHWKRHALRAATTYNTLMSMAVVAAIIEPLCNHWR